MKTSDKLLIFNLLKAAGDNFYGYSDPSFLQVPEFHDDPEPKIIKKEPTADTKIQSQPQIQAEAINPSPSLSESNIQKEESAPSQEKKPHGLTLQELEAKIRSCTNCELCRGRTNVVPGQGVTSPSVLVIGEGPGEEEDKQGLPFVGPAGKLLDKMLAAIQLDRHINCYIANTVKCRPPYNRDPKPEEAVACRAFLDAQIHILKPKMILLVGKVALRNIMSLEGEISLRRYRGRVYTYSGIPMIVTYHPSALLRNADYKKLAWEDLKFFKLKLLEVDPHYADKFSGAIQK